MYSMTGYGRGSASRDGRELTVELKSVNHRYLDLGIRLPRHLAFLEDAIRGRLALQFSRGHIDVFVNYHNSRSDARTVEINAPLLAAYLASARSIGESLHLVDDLSLSAALHLPDVATPREADEDTAAVLSLLETALSDAIDALTQMRAQEGSRLAADLLPRMDAIENLITEIAQRAPLVVQEYRAKLSERIEALLAGVELDQSRLANEVAYFADRASIDEEIVRLRSHTRQAYQLLVSDEPVGRKLDFIVQEMNRELNTIGSKANDGALSSLVLDGKADVEKIREQIQNIE